MVYSIDDLSPLLKYEEVLGASQEDDQAEDELSPSGRPLSPRQPGFDTCIPTMASYSHLEEYVGAPGQLLDRAALAMVSRYREQASSRYCRVSCKECLAACPANVAVNDVLRLAMYHEDYGMERMAADHYAELESGRKPLGCTVCAAPCESACPFGPAVQAKLVRAHEILSARQGSRCAQF